MKRSTLIEQPTIPCKASCSALHGRVTHANSATGWGKLLGTILESICPLCSHATTHIHNTQAQHSPLSFVQVGWFVAYLGSTLYTFLWDVAMDWRLLPWQNVATCQYGEHALRDKSMVFRSKRAYYGVIAVNKLIDSLYIHTYTYTYTYI